jgi:hypothetical protein
MSNNYESELNEFLFHLRTPLNSIRGTITLVDKAEVVGIKFSPEAREWLRKWAPKVDIWLNEVIELTALYRNSEPQDHDWEKLMQHLLSTLEGAETAAREANDIPLSISEEPGDFVRMMVNSINYINYHYKAMRDLFPPSMA